MNPTNSFTFSSGTIEGSPSKERWSPGDPLPWSANVIEGVPCTVLMSAQWQRTLKSDFIVKSDDAFVVTFPKSGTTWTLQIVKCLRTAGEPETLTATLDDLFPFIECGRNRHVTTLNSIPSPRVFKSHSTYSMVPKVKEGQSPCKYVHVMRHPKDTCVSLYYHMTAVDHNEYNGPFSEFFDLFIHGMVELGSWFEYEKAWWEHRHDPNVLLVKYEDMHADPHGIVQRIASFLGIEATPEIVQKTVEKSQFKTMKKDNTANLTWYDHHRNKGSTPHMRKGIVGDWKSHFSEEQSKEFDRVFHEKLDGTGLEHEWEL